MRKPNIRPRARRDIVSHILYLDDVAGIEIAAKFDKNINLAFDQLMKFSGMGTPVDTTRPRLKGLRKWRVDDFERYLIFYLPKPHGIDVLYVKHSSQNWWQQLGVKKKPQGEEPQS